MARPAGTDVIEVLLDASELRVKAKVGTLYPKSVRTDSLAPFQYEPAWLHTDHAFLLDPRLELWNGEQYPPADAPAFGIFMDSAPDHWGRFLMERREAAAARREGRAVRALQELDFLLGAHDLTRMSARIRKLARQAERAGDLVGRRAAKGEFHRQGRSVVDGKVPGASRPL
jgi:serine/threonine-protein kinase HipA